MSTVHDVHFDDTLAATRGRSNHYFSFATWPIGVGTPRCYLCAERKGNPWIDHIPGTTRCALFEKQPPSGSREKSQEEPSRLRGILI